MAPLAVALAGIAASVASHSGFRNLQEQKTQQIMQADSAAQIQAVKSEINASLEVLESVRSLYHASTFIDRSEFQTFVSPILKNHEDIQAVEWIPKVTHDKRQQYETEARADGISGFTITQRNENSEMSPAGLRDTYFPVYYVEPLKGNEAAVGFDLASNPTRLAALNTARDSGNQVATARITLVQEKEKQAGLLIFDPVYEGAASYPRLQERRDKLKGFVLIVLRAGDVINHAAEGYFRDVDVHVEDITDLENADLIFSSLREGAATSATYSQVDILDVAGRRWEITAVPRLEAYADQSWTAMIVLWSGLIFTALTSIILVQIIRRRKYVEGLVRERTSELRQLSTKMELILEHAGEGIYGLDLKGHTTFVNKAAVSGLGYSLEEMLHTSQHALIHHHRPDGSVYPREECNIYRALKDGKVHTEDKEVFWKKDGAPLPVEYSSSPIWDEEGEISGAVVVFRDITERKEAEANLRMREDERERLIEKLEVMNKDLDHFAYVASHDLRAPLRGMDNLIQWVREDLPDDIDIEVSNKLKLLSGRVERMEKLLGDILAYSRAGKRESAPERVDCGSLLKEVTEWVSAPTGFDIQIETPLPTFTTSKTLLEQVFLNLISNAVKHHDRTDGKIIIRHREHDWHHEFVIEDDGPGISAKYHDRIFTMFQTLKPRDEVEGSGIGLAIVKRMVEAGNGRVWIRSPLGERGTAFHFTIGKPEISEENIEEEDDGGWSARDVAVG